MPKRILYPLLALLLAFSFILSLFAGSAALSFETMLDGLLGLDGGETAGFILYALRLPRILAALIAGVGLSVAGVILQSVLGNPLAGPNTIGVNAGAGLAVVLCLSVLPGALALLPFAAFCGAFLTSLLILGFSKLSGGGRGTVVLAGVALTSFFQAFITFFSTLDTDVLSLYAAFSVGSFSGITGSRLLLPGVLVAVCLILALCLSGKIAALSLGDAVASSLGLRVGVMRTICLVLASMSAAAVISYAGLLGFVGLIVPHISRKLFGPVLFHQIAGSAFVGGILVLLADLAGRTLFAPSELSVGILLSLIGAPFFCILLLTRQKEG